MNVWTRDDTLVLLRLYKRYPILYDPRYFNYKKVSSREKIYRLIFHQIKKIKPDITINDIKSKLRTIRSQYNRELKRFKNYKDKNKPYKPTLWFFHDASFLSINEGDTETPEDSENMDINETTQEDENTEMIEDNSTNSNIIKFEVDDTYEVVSDNLKETPKETFLNAYMTSLEKQKNLEKLVDEKNRKILESTNSQNSQYSAGSSISKNQQFKEEEEEKEYEEDQINEEISNLQTEIIDNFEYVEIPSEMNNSLGNNIINLDSEKSSTIQSTNEINFTSISKYEAFSIYMCKELENIQLEHNFDEAKKTITTFIWKIIEKDKKERKLMPSSSEQQSDKNTSTTVCNNNNILESKFKTFIKKFPKSLTEIGYDFNEDGVLCRIDNTGEFCTDNVETSIERMHPKNSEIFDELVARYIYDLLEKNGLQKIYVPDNIPIEEAGFIFCTPEAFSSAKKLLVIMNGSGSIKAGQWSKKLIINCSLNHGSQISYIERAKELGYEILITNANDNYRNINGKIKRIPGSHTALSHGLTIWENYIIRSHPQAVAIVAQGYGGLITIEMAQKFSAFFKDNVFGIVLLESIHLMNELDDEIHDTLIKYGRHYVASTKPLDEELSSTEIPKYSAGHKNPDYAPYSSMPAIFDFLEKKYEDFLVVEE